MTAPAAGLASYRDLPRPQLAAMAVQLGRDLVRHGAQELPAAHTELLPAGERRRLIGRRRIQGAEPFEAALCGRAHGWPLREIAHASRRRTRLGRALAGVYTASSQADPALALWVFHRPAEADRFTLALAESGQGEQVMGRRANVVVTGSGAAETRSRVERWLSDLLGAA